MLRTDVQVTYIGGGSREWARTFMYDLALQGEFCGVIKLYDIDIEAAECNKIIGGKVAQDPKAKSKWRFEVCKTLEESLKGSDFVVISILPGTFDEMESDVHEGEKYGIYQAVGDTVGPGGLVRAMRTVPIYEGFADAIKRICPDAFVINFTNPMTLCTKTLYDVFPSIKAFGCCHEVFNTQKILAQMVTELLGEQNVARRDIKTDVLGINHFTWFTKASYKGTDLFPIYEKYVEKHINDGPQPEMLSDPLISSNIVKMDLFRRYGQIAAAGDRHLAEFVNNSWYLKDPKTVADWRFTLTSVEFRRKQLQTRLETTYALVKGTRPIEIKSSEEEFGLLMQGLLGIKDVVSNVNLPNNGQAPFAPKGAIVETNALFSKGKIIPQSAEPLKEQIQSLVLRQVYQQENAIKAIRKRNLHDTFNVFMSDPLCSNLTFSDGEKLFSKMINNTKKYLYDWKI